MSRKATELSRMLQLNPTWIRLLRLLFHPRCIWSNFPQSYFLPSQRALTILGGRSLSFLRPCMAPKHSFVRVRRDLLLGSIVNPVGNSAGQVLGGVVNGVGDTASKVIGGLQSAAQLQHSSSTSVSSSTLAPSTTTPSPSPTPKPNGLNVGGVLGPVVGGVNSLVGGVVGDVSAVVGNVANPSVGGVTSGVGGLTSMLPNPTPGACFLMFGSGIQ